MSGETYAPLFQISRGGIVESIHYGSIAVSDQDGRILAYYGNPQVITFLRSIAKPIQAIPFVEDGGMEHYGLNDAELAIICGSHSGTDDHVRIISSLQAKVDVRESDLICGVQNPIHEPTAQWLTLRGESPSPNRHNCSGNHTGMLAYAKMMKLTLSGYNLIDHPIQQRILDCISEFSQVSRASLLIGGDGCGIPTYAMPIAQAAKMYARLCNPIMLNSSRITACQKITSAMTKRPEMVAGPERLDTDLVIATQGKMISKTGIEGYQVVGLKPNKEKRDSLGIAVKISDGDFASRARPAVIVEILRQLELLSDLELGRLKQYGPTTPIQDSVHNVVGEGKPVFNLQAASG